MAAVCSAALLADYGMRMHSWLAVLQAFTSIQLHKSDYPEDLFTLAMTGKGRGKMADAEDHYAHAVESAGKI